MHHGGFALVVCRVLGRAGVHAHGFIQVSQTFWDVDIISLTLQVRKLSHIEAKDTLQWQSHGAA